MIHRVVLRVKKNEVVSCWCPKTNDRLCNFPLQVRGKFHALMPIKDLNFKLKELV